MLRINKAEEQAIRLIMRLAMAAEPLTLAELAVAEQVTRPTVAKLLGRLRRNGVVEAIRGRNGGYLLATAADRITTAQIVRAVCDGNIADVPCQRKSASQRNCPRSNDCGLRPVWQYLQSQVVDCLESTTVADLINVEHGSDASPSSEPVNIHNLNQKRPS